MIARVYVTPKSGVLDPQGKSVHQSLRSLGFGEVADVRIGKYIEIILGPQTSKTEAAQKVEAMCEQLLANGVVEDYRFDLLETP